MRVNINLKNFRNRDREGLVIENECDDKKIEPKRRRAIRELKEKEFKKKQQSSVMISINKRLKDIIIKLKDKDKVKDSLKKTPVAYYILFFLTVVLCTIGMLLNINTYKELGREKYSIYTANDNAKYNNIDNSNIVHSNKYEKDSSSISQKAKESKAIIANSSNVVVSSKKAPIDNSKVKGVKNPSTEIKKEEYIFKYIKPIEGAKVSKIFSIDNVIYSKTLDMWKIHEGLDFLADIGTKVMAIEKGKIEKIYTDSLYGVSIILNHGNGYKSVYRNLDEKTFVKEGQSVVKGQNIALVGNTAICEIKDESHLHFELIKNADIVNPAVIGIF